MAKAVSVRVHESIRCAGELTLRAMDGGFGGAIGRELLAAGFAEGDAVVVVTATGDVILGAEGELVIDGHRLFCARGIRSPLRRAGAVVGDVLQIVPLAR